MALSNVLGLQTPIYFALCNQKHIREPNSPNSWLLPFYNYPQSRGFTTVGSQRPREIFNLLQWALNDPVKSSFQRKEQKKVPWAVEYQNSGLSWIYPVHNPSYVSRTGFTFLGRLKSLLYDSLHDTCYTHDTCASVALCMIHSSITHLLCVLTAFSR